MKAIKLKERPVCDFCDKPAIYDGKTKMSVWAYMCSHHYEEFCEGLGLGRGQIIEVEK